MKNIITKKQVNEEKEIIKQVDKKLVAERIAIEIKAQSDAKLNFHQSLSSYLISAKSSLNYSDEENDEILKLSKMILKEEYNIDIISEFPFECVKN